MEIMSRFRLRLPLTVLRKVRLSHFSPSKALVHLVIRNTVMVLTQVRECLEIFIFRLMRRNINRIQIVGELGA